MKWTRGGDRDAKRRKPDASGVPNVDADADGDADADAEADADASSDGRESIEKYTDLPNEFPKELLVGEIAFSRLDSPISASMLMSGWEKAAMSIAGLGRRSFNCSASETEDVKQESGSDSASERRRFFSSPSVTFKGCS